jgi:hypothetical protein
MLGLFIAVTMALCLLSWAEQIPNGAGLANAGARAGGDKATKPVATDTHRGKWALPRLKLRLPRLRRKSAPAPHHQATEIAPVAPLEEARALTPHEAASESRDAEILSRISEMLAPPDHMPGPRHEEPAAPALQSAPGSTAELSPETKTAAPAARSFPELPVVEGFEPGDIILLELIGPAPRREDIRFRPCANGALVEIEGEPALIIASTAPEALDPGILQFRAHAAA